MNLMQSHGRRALTLMMGMAAAAPLRAHGDEHKPVPLLPAYVAECSSCHLAFAPALLPAASWQRLMSSLARHYGSDASLDATTTRALSDWLVAHAATGRRAAEPPRDDRITRAAWFQREHREVRGRFATAAVKSPSDCAACHTRAAEGSWRESEIRMPPKG